MIRTLSTKSVYANLWMSLREDEVEFANGVTGKYAVVEKDHFVVIIPFDGTHFHLIEQYRYPIGRRSLEFPQGKHEGEKTIDPRSLANAELEEETGLKAKQMIELGFVQQAPGYSTQGFFAYFATDLFQGETKFDETEADLVHAIMAPSDFEQAIIDGSIIDSTSIVAYSLLKLKKLL